MIIHIDPNIRELSKGILGNKKIQCNPLSQPENCMGNFYDTADFTSYSKNGGRRWIIGNFTMVQIPYYSDLAKNNSKAIVNKYIDSNENIEFTKFPQISSKNGGGRRNVKQRKTKRRKTKRRKTKRRKTKQRKTKRRNSKKR